MRTKLETFADSVHITQDNALYEFAKNTVDFELDQVGRLRVIDNSGAPITPFLAYAQYQIGSVPALSLNEVILWMRSNFFAEPSGGGVPSDATISINGDLQNLADNPEFTLPFASTEPIYTYTHSGNRVVNITSIDYATGIFTATAHGLTSTIAANDGANRLFLVFKTDNLTVDLAPTIPMTDSSPASSSSDKGYYIRVIDADTFKLALAYAGADLVLTDKGTIDFTKWHFEQSLVSDLMTFSGIGGALEIDVILNGQWGNSVRYMSQINGVTSFLGLFNRLGEEIGNTTNLGDGMRMDFGVALYNGTQILNFKKDKQGFTLNASQKSFDIGSTSLRGNNKMSNGFTPSAETSINSITLSRLAISNGTTIKIFKKS